jgi:hypothetical protein
MNGDHFSSRGDPLLPREIREQRMREERRKRRDDAVKALRQAVLCLRLEVPASIANDVQGKAEAVIAILREWDFLPG